MSPEPSRLFRHPLRCPCARCRVEAGLLLLRTGRAAMALSVLEAVPELITETLGWAYAKGHDDVVLGRSSVLPPGRGHVVPFPATAPDRTRLVA